ncbi:hypothetical protein [Micromonospora globispora]|uniref:hypothetical protein n=1 Tax=Micromonospora globispora TaxID=1450148 RepID=UPI001FAFFD49|nr:hypothetical protein [Micromonospora globispora]
MIWSTGVLWSKIFTFGPKSGVPLGANDRQIPLEYAHRSYEQAVNSPKRELRVFTPEEGATEHIGLDHLPHVSTFIADWVADTFAELSAQAAAQAS